MNEKTVVVKPRKGAVRRLGIVEGPDLRRAVTVKLFKVKTEAGECSELEFRPMCSRNPVRVSLERLVRMALSEGPEQCGCLFGASPSSGRVVDDPAQLVIPGCELGEVAS
jgi:hypothetical protein